MKVVAIVQARMGSTRLPKKVMLPICGQPMISFLLNRLSQARLIDQILVATTDHSRDQELVNYVCQLGYMCYQGSEQDVLDRYYQAAKNVCADVVIRITGDCPLVDPELVDLVITKFFAENVDYASNNLPATYPDGLDVEVFSFKALEESWYNAQNAVELEHVTPYLRKANHISRINVPCFMDYSAKRWTVDEKIDFTIIKDVFEHFAPNKNFSWLEVLNLQNNQPNLFVGNKNIKRNEGMFLGQGQKLWKRAKLVIPGGNMLLSKRPEMFLPDQWPSYFSKAKGCKVWDLDGKEYIDMSIMGIGTNILGYGHDEIDAVVHQVVESGNMSTLNCPEEVYLAEKLIEIHPWAEMVKFARTGGEANAIAIRIARAASGKDKIAICGYHGWHDWYLSANLGDDQNLSGHLLPGLSPNGVPQNLRGTVFPFNYNCYDELEALVNQHDIGVIQMEVVRNSQPQNDFLCKIRKLATDRGIVLIFDECTSGFRETFGGLHKKYDVEPDLAMFGKALGNGYAITAIIGKRSVMEAAQTTFISSTFWTERIGPVAALKTLEIMKRLQSWDLITKTGQQIQQGWNELAKKHSLTINISGLPSLSSFTFNGENALMYKTFITQEMLSKGYLAGTSVYSSIAHTPEIVAQYFADLDPIFGLIAECENGRDVISLLHGPVCHAGFKRLN